MAHILLISSDRVEPIDFFRNLRETLDFSLTVISRHQYREIFSELADTIQTVDDLADITQLNRILLEVSREVPVDAIVSPTEKGVLAGGFLRSQFAIPGPGVETALWMTNKLAMKTRLKELGIPVANFKRLGHPMDLPRAAEILKWPLIVKPAMGSGRRGTRFIPSLEHYEMLLNEHVLDDIGTGVPWMAEQFIQMEEYHADAILFRGELKFISVSKYFEPLLQANDRMEGSYLLNEGHIMLREIGSLMTRVTDAFRLTDGPVHMEVFYTNQSKLLVGEVALRVGGGGISGAIACKYGFSLWDESLRIAIHQEPVVKVNRQEGVFGWFTIPCRDGIIESYTSPEAMREIPGVLDVEMHYRQGDQVQKKNGVEYELCTVLFRVEREEQILPLISQVETTLNLCMRGES